MTDFCQLQLTCTDKREADKVAGILLKKHLVACIKQVPITSAFWWESKIEESNEVLLLMESKTSLFEEIEKEVGKNHSYKTFVLQAIPLLKVSNKAKLWLNKEARGDKA